jgi:hypothetical protein
VAFFKLRTYREIEMIKWEKETIKKIEQKDLRFFFRPDNYIDSDDYKKYNEMHDDNSIEVKEKKEKHSEEEEEDKNDDENEEKKDQKKSDKKDKKKDPYNRIKKQDILFEEQKKFFEEEKKKERNKYKIIYDFIDKYNNYANNDQKKEVKFETKKNEEDKDNNNLNDNQIINDQIDKLEQNEVVSFKSN